MPKRSIIQALNAVPQGGSPQHGFDLMNFEDFHSKGGQLTVVGVRDTVPNADYRVGVDAFTRSLPFNTANFSRIKENYYFVHVPLGLLCSNAYQMLVDRKQPYSSLDQGIAQFPTFSLAAVVSRCLDIAHSSDVKFKDVHGFNIGRGALKLFDLLGYGCFLDILEATFIDVSSGGINLSNAKTIVESVLAGKRPTANRLAAYQCVWYHFFRNDIYDNAVTARSFNFDDVVYKSSSSEPSYDILSVRDLDDFIIECCQLRYVGYKKDIFMGSMPGTQFGPVSSVAIDIDLTSATATLSGLSGSFSGNSVTPTGSFSGSFVGSDSYFNGSTGSDNGRHEVKTSYGSAPSGNVSGSFEAVNPPSSTPTGSTDLNSPVLTAMYDISGTGTPVPCVVLRTGEYVSYEDYMSNPSGYSPLYNSHSHSFGGSVVPNGTISGRITINPITPSGSVNLNSGEATVEGLSGTSLFDVLSLVEAQAIQKWRQKSMLAGNKTVDQFRAHHGVVPRHLTDHLPDFIGSVDNEIHVTEITSTADTASQSDESNLGDIRGRGYGASDSRTFNFHCDDYGILFLLHAIVPENTYSSFGIDKGNTMVSYTDFFQNEFQNIGLDVVPKYLLDPTPNAVPQNPSKEGGEGFNPSVGVVGYGPRYYNYKEYPSRVHGMFNPSRLFINDTPWQGNENPFGYADMQSFVMPRNDMTGVININTTSGIIGWVTMVMNLSKIYVNPSVFNSIFLQNADSSELTDNFFSHVKFICDASQPMTVLGLPQF